MANAVKKRDLFWLHVIITLFFMFGFGFLPAPAPITPAGMKVVGVFIGLVYAWSTTSMIWPSLIGILALVLNDCITLKDFMAGSFGHDTVVFTLFVLIFIAAVDGAGVTQIAAEWIMSRKVLQGRPWMLSFGLLAGAALVSSVTSTIPVTLIFWSILYGICRQVGYKPYEKYPTMMILGIAICAVIGSDIFPFRLTPMVMLGIYKSVSGITVDFVQYISFMAPVVACVVLTYIFICRFVLRLDVSKLAAASTDFINTDNLTLNKQQKIVLSFLIAFIVLAILPTLLPKELFLAVILNKLSLTGVTIGLVALLLWVKVDGKPIVSFKELASRGIVWDMILLFVVVLPVSDLMVAEETGVKQFLIGILNPIFGSVSPAIFMFLVLFMPAILTNFANNGVVMIIFMQLIFSMAGTLGVDPTPLILLLIVVALLAFYTPAASAPAAVVFGNADWIKAKDIYTYGGIAIIIEILVTIIFGLVWAAVIF